jgi:hypothetical protein
MDRVSLLPNRALLTGLLFLTGALSSCALFVPQVAPIAIKKVDSVTLTSCYLAVGASTEERTAAANEIQGGQPETNTSARIALCWAYTYAEQWRQAYISAARQHSGTRAIAGAVTIPLAGVAAFKGATQNNARNSTTGLLIGAAALYGAVSYLTSLSREEVYLNGALAMSCVRGASQPLLQATARFSALERAKNDLSLSLKTFDGLTTGLDLSLPQNADLVVSRANALNTLNKAEDLTVTVHGFAETLRNRVDTISIQVAKLIKSSEPSPQSMLSILSSIGTISGGLQAGFTIPKPEAKAGEKPEGEVQAGRDPKLTAAQSDLELKTQTVQEELKLVSTAAESAQKAAKEGDCTPQGVKATFSVSPDAATLVVAQGGVTKLTVTAGDGFPSTPIVEGNDAGFIEVDPYNINTSAPNSDQFVLTIHGVKATDKSTPVLKITDHANEVRKSIAISVTAASAGKPAGQPKKNETASGDGESITKPESDLLKASTVLAGEMQCVIDTPVDCKVGTKTRDAIVAYRKKKSLPSSREIDQKLVGAVLADLDGDKTACKDKGKELQACK